MAPSPLRSITRKHARSNSLPSRPYPLLPHFDQHLCRVRAAEATTSSSLLSMSNRLDDHQELYDCTDDVLLLPHIQKAISQECQEKWADEFLDRYLRILDACSSTRGLFSHTKQSIRELLSTLRRKDTNQLSCYLSSRKEKKIIQKALKDLNKRNQQMILPSVKDNETMALVSMLKEVESVTLAIFESFLSYVNGTKSESRNSGWSLVSKLINSRVSDQKEVTNTNDFEKVHATLHSLISHKMSNSGDIKQIEEIQLHLGKIQSSIRIIEEKLECLFRSLIKSRVLFLNVLNH